MTIPGEQSGTDDVLSHERNWSELPKDILHLISKKLPDIFDFICFRAVCESWQLSAPVNDRPPPLPWLLERRLPKHRPNAIIRFYCLSSGKVHTITCPGSLGACLHGPRCRYLLASHSGSSERYLLNPLTDHKICVPNYIGPDTMEGGDIVVMSENANMRAFWLRKADNWVYVEGVDDWYGGNAYYMGQYFSRDNDTGITNVFDIATKKLAYQVAPPDGTNPLLKGRTTLVESGGKILRLFYHSEARQCQFDIYCLYFGDGGGKPCWVKITDIGDQMLFLQYNRGLSFCASNIAGFKRNCIYFLQARRYLCRYNIGNGTTEVLPCPFDAVGTWFVPSLV